MIKKIGKKEIRKRDRKKYVYMYIHRKARNEKGESGLIYHETLEVFKSESQVKFPPSDVLF